MASSPQSVLCRYHYDPLDRLAGTTPAGQPDALRFYQQNRLATEIHGAVKRTIIQHENLLLAQYRHLDSGVEATLLAADQQRSVLHLLDNNDTHALAYNPYGHLPAESGISSLLGFNGEHRDPVTGHYLLGNGYRGFNPVLMRFNSPDSWSPFGEGGINAYGYCAGDPVNFQDPTGHIRFLFPPPSQPRVPMVVRPAFGPILRRALQASTGAGAAGNRAVRTLTTSVAPSVSVGGSGVSTSRAASSTPSVSYPSTTLPRAPTPTPEVRHEQFSSRINNPHHTPTSQDFEDFKWLEGSLNRYKSRGGNLDSAIPPERLEAQYKSTMHSFNVTHKQARLWYMNQPGGGMSQRVVAVREGMGRDLHSAKVQANDYSLGFLIQYMGAA